MNTKLKCLLLDDELPGLAYTRLLCEQIPSLQVVKAFDDPGKFLAAVKNTDFDLCIMDIEMPGLSGLDVAKELGDKLFIFTTAYKEYAAEAFDLNAVDYVRKPIQKERLELAVSKAFNVYSNSKNSGFVLFNTDRGKARLNFDEIIYITTSDTDRRDKIVHLENRTTITVKNTSFFHLLSVLPASGFCRINKKDVIAISHVKAYSAHEISLASVLADNMLLKLPLNDVYRAGFRKLYH